MEEEGGPGGPDERPETQGANHEPGEPAADDLEEIEGEGGAELFTFLQSKFGYDLAVKLLELVKELKKSTLDRNVEQDKFNAEQGRLQLEFLHRHSGRVLLLQAVVFTLAIVAASVLTYYGKFESPVAVLFGTLVGYFFGRRTSKDV